MAADNKKLHERIWADLDKVLEERTAKYLREDEILKARYEGFNEGAVYMAKRAANLAEKEG